LATLILFVAEQEDGYKSTVLRYEVELVQQIGRNCRVSRASVVVGLDIVASFEGEIRRWKRGCPEARKNKGLANVQIAIPTSPSSNESDTYGAFFYEDTTSDRRLALGKSCP
jgi:hypothetical protein